MGEDSASGPDDTDSLLDQSLDFVQILYISCLGRSKRVYLQIVGKIGGISGVVEEYKPHIQNLAKQLRHSIIFGGIVAGLTYAVVSPFILPAVTGLQANAGFLIDEPKFNVELHNNSTSDFGQTSRNNASQTHVVVIENTQNRLAQDVRFNFYFDGCAVNSEFYYKNDSVAAYPGVQFGQSGCIETIYIPDLAKNEKIILEYEINESKQGYVPPVDSAKKKDLVYYVFYEWRLHGMVFSERTIGSQNTTPWRGRGPGLPG